MAKIPSIFIFGVSSHLGANLAKFLRKDYRVLGSYHNNEIKIPRVLTFKCDVRDKQQVKWLLGKFRPDYVFFSAGIPSMTFCEKNPKASDDITQQGLINVIAASENIGAKLYYFSSSFIFAGDNIFYSESENPSPLNHYGNIMSNAEFFVQRTSFNYLIFRLCSIFGRGPSFKQENWFEVTERHTRENKTLFCDDHIYNGYLDIRTFCKVIKHSLESDISNRLFQLSSADICSRLGFVEKYEKLTKKKITKVARDAYFPLTEKHQANGNFQFHLSVRNIEDTFNIKLPTIEESLESYLNFESDE